MMRHNNQFFPCVFLCLSACLFEAPTVSRFIPNDSGVVAIPSDATANDVSEPSDLGSTEDAGLQLDVGDRTDAGSSRDGSADASRDAGRTDAVIHSDAETTDGRIQDALVEDNGIHPDAEPRDSGVHSDAAGEDTGWVADVGSTDLGIPDSGMVSDSGASDSGQRLDTGVTDTGVDAGPRDAGIPAGYVVIPAGSFMMGSHSGEPNRFPDEGPQHQVTITRRFFMKQTEITRAEWFTVMGFLPQPQALCFAPTNDNCPVTTMDRDLLILYANTLSSREGLPECYVGVPFNWTFAGVACLGYRLPTEAEWEYAARAGTTTPYPYVPGSGQQTLDDIALYVGNSMGEVRPVCTRQPNAWGLCDMIGNAHEVLHGRLADSYVGAIAVDPEESGGVFLNFWCTRGCDYTSNARNCRVATRGGHTIDQAGTEIHGGRLVRTAP